jgi:hypothetical protein
LPRTGRSFILNKGTIWRSCHLSYSGDSGRFFHGIQALKNAERDAFLEKVINDPSYREDLINIALIEEAKKVKGKLVSTREYFEKRRSTK